MKDSSSPKSVHCPDMMPADGAAARERAQAGYVAHGAAPVPTWDTVQVGHGTQCCTSANEQTCRRAGGVVVWWGYSVRLGSLAGLRQPQPPSQRRRVSEPVTGLTAAEVRALACLAYITLPLPGTGTGTGTDSGSSNGSGTPLRWRTRPNATARVPPPCLERVVDESAAPESPDQCPSGCWTLRRTTATQWLGSRVMFNQKKPPMHLWFTLMEERCDKTYRMHAQRQPTLFHTTCMTVANRTDLRLSVRLASSRSEGGQCWPHHEKVC